MTRPAHPDAAFFRRSKALGTYFRPSAPIDTDALLRGRVDQIGRIIAAVNGVGEHVAVYGEAGVGKTSLSLVAQAIINSSDMANCVRVQCSSDDTFASIWRKFGEFLYRDARRQRIPQASTLTTAFEKVAENGPVPLETPTDTFFLLDRLGDAAPLVIVVDEFDRVGDWSIRSNMANLIKLLSDERSPVTLIVVGVGDDIASLVAEHTSIDRNLKQIPMPRLEENELEEILTAGFSAAELDWESDVLRDIARVSRGLPHYVHLMGRHIGEIALSYGRDGVEESDWSEALRVSVGDAQETVAREYDDATTSFRADALYEHVLLACALTPGDEWGYFKTQAVASTYSRIMGKVKTSADVYRHLQAFLEEDRACVLVTRGEGRSTRYRFKNPLVQPYAILRGLQSSMISRADVPPLPAVRTLPLPE